MYAFFAKLLNMSLTAGILALVVMVLRAGLKKAPKKYLCILWALVALRLLCPVSLSGPMSAYTLLHTETDDYGQVEVFRYNGKTEKPMLEMELPEIAPNPVASSDAPAQTHKPDVYLPAFMAIWTMGAAAMLIYAGYSYRRLRNEVSASIPAEDGVFVCDEIPSPFILGILHPRIYLPSGLPEPVRKNVLAHEQAHLKRCDHWWKPLGYLLLSFHWFNPVLWAAYILFCRDVESACDEKVIADADRDAVSDYMQALLSCSVRRRTVSACPLAFGESGVKERVRNILNYQKPKVWIAAAAVILCAAVGVLFLTDPPAVVDTICLQDMTSPDPYCVTYRVDLGRTVHSGTLRAEHWQNGVCTQSTPVLLNDRAGTVLVNIFPHRGTDGVSITSFEVQIATDTGDALSSISFETEETVQGFSFSALEKGKKTAVEPDMDVFLAAVGVDRGNGTTSLSCLDTDRVLTAEDMIVVRAVFHESAACVFTADVLEAENGILTVVPIPGMEELRSADRFCLSAEGMPGGENVKPGQRIEITYDGSILETYPASLGEIYSIRTAEESELPGSEYYLTIGDDDVTTIEVSLPNSSGTCVNADGSAYRRGEQIWLEPLSGCRDLTGLHITAYAGSGRIVWRIDFPENMQAGSMTELADGEWAVYAGNG